MLNTFNYFFSRNKIKSFIKPSNSVLKFHNFILYKFFSFLYDILSLFVYPFQRGFVNLYTVLLQANRLPFRVLPEIFKTIIIYFANVELWFWFLSRVKNNVNIYLLREKKFPYLHKLWVLYYRDLTKYHYELNVRRQDSNEISNYYYSTRISENDGSVSTRVKYKFILFYFFNKIALNNYPYFYWTTIRMYNKYGTTDYSELTSQHIRTQVFFIFMYKTKTFFKSTENVSFAKLTVKTFKGFNNVLKVLASGTYVFTKTRELLFDTARTPYTQIEKTTFVESLNSYKGEKGTPNKALNSRLNIIISNAVYQYNKILTKLNTTKLNSLVDKLPVKWYNKVHNSIVNPTKNNVVMYLRSSKHFNKGRYSRNRQLYRTGVYWCIWLNVVIVYALHYYFYRVVFSFGYLWLPLGVLILSMFGNRLYKYRFYSFEQIKIEFVEYSNFLYINFSKLVTFTTKFLPQYASPIKKFVTNYIYLFSQFLEIKYITLINFIKKLINL